MGASIGEGVTQDLGEVLRLLETDGNLCRGGLPVVARKQVRDRVAHIGGQKEECVQAAQFFDQNLVADDFVKRPGDEGVLLGAGKIAGVGPSGRAGEVDHRMAGGGAGDLVKDD